MALCSVDSIAWDWKRFSTQGGLRLANAVTTWNIASVPGWAPHQVLPAAHPPEDPAEDAPCLLAFNSGVFCFPFVCFCFIVFGDIFILFQKHLSPVRLPRGIIPVSDLCCSLTPLLRPASRAPSSLFSLLAIF